MSTIIVKVRTADQTRQSEMTVERTHTGGDIIQSSIDNWSLPSTADYNLVNTTSGKQIGYAQSLSEAIVKDGDILEVQPVLVAGVIQP
jgi:hypothetical protein